MSWPQRDRAEFTFPRFVPATGSSDAPRWIDAREVVDASGNILPHLVDVIRRGEELQERIETAHRSGVREPDDCLRSGIHIVPARRFSAPTSLLDLEHLVETVVRGTVVGETTGFSHGFPRTLLAVRIDDILKDGGRLRGIDVVLLSWPAARIDLGPACLEGRQGKWPYPPEPGADVLLFPYEANIRHLERRIEIQAFLGQEAIFEIDSGLAASPWVLHLPEVQSASSIDELSLVRRRKDRAP